ncbi:OmpP1/FadL family transporter [Candidatus Endoriftia persephone]|jgi:long-chain fatty acid transport protein|nr:outer membrane protein transport protein [Candidatus Endoriftia persephone]EGV51795.1 membrane protein involved in aromatic hydrocarbon degradation [endosymbiont of Riftia pachyptila (vent Ph05)]USF88363.1 outer membrane protein transport protein [Candidatus Endoriftia persephone]
MSKNKSFKIKVLSITCGVTAAFSAQQVAASGFAVPELSVAGLATSNAMVANHKELGALPYNPSAMAFHEGSSVSFGALLIKPGLSVTTGNGTFDSDGNGLVAVPSISAHHTLTENWSIGLAVNAPFGLETDWSSSTFIQSAQNPGGYAPGTSMPTRSKLEIVDFSPALAYKLNDNASLAAGVDLYWLKKVIFNSKVNDGASFPDVTLEGDGRGVGFHLSGLYVAGDWSFGGSYHTSSDIPVEGQIQSPTGNSDANTSLEVPSRLQLGIRHQTTKKLALEFDFTRTGWSSFDSIIVKDSTYSTTLMTSENKWKDVNAYRIGGTYDLTQATQLRAGYTFDETPQGDERFSVRVPDADRHLFSIGVGHSFDNDWLLDVGYMYVKFDERTLNQPAPTGTELNGTSVVNGTYDSDVHLFGISINRVFM